MRTLATSIASLLAVTAAAQSPLLVAPTGGGFYGWPVPSADHQTFFDLTVHTTITLRSLATPLVGPAGETGTIQVWLTNTGVTTFAGNETNAANWHLAASGIVRTNGTTGTIAQLTCESCLEAAGGGLVLPPGSYGCAIRYLGVADRFYAVPAGSQTFANAELTVSGGAIQYHAFNSPPSLPGGGYAGYRWFGELHYANGAVPHACADTLSYGSGCALRHGSIYESYFTSAAVVAALNGRSLSFVPNGAGGYEVMQGIGHVFRSPGPLAFQLPSTSDGERLVTLTTPFAHPGGLATDLFVHANGIVSLASNQVLSGPNWIPSVPAFLDAPATAWWCWHDFNPTENGSGGIWFEEDPSTGFAYVTWLGVESYPNGPNNPSTLQMVFETGSGVVTMIFEALDPIGGSTIPSGDKWVVGYSPGGASMDPGPQDLASLATGVAPIVILSAGDVLPLRLDASAKPRLGTSIDLRTTNETGTSLGVLFVSATPIYPGVDLTFLGAPGCAALVDIGSGFALAFTNAVPGGMDVPLAIPNTLSLLGALFFGQSIWLDPTANPFGVVTSNGLVLKIGNH